MSYTFICADIKHAGNDLKRWNPKATVEPAHAFGFVYFASAIDHPFVNIILELYLQLRLDDGQWKKCTAHGERRQHRQREEFLKFESIRKDYHQLHNSFHHFTFLFIISHSMVLRNGVADSILRPLINVNKKLVDKFHFQLIQCHETKFILEEKFFFFLLLFWCDWSMTLKFRWNFQLIGCSY